VLSGEFKPGLSQARLDISIASTGEKIIDPGQVIPRCELEAAPFFDPGFPDT